jgi:hypothetical protein
MRFLSPKSLFLVAALSGVAACGETGETEEDDIRAGERKLVGEAAPYAADRSLAGKLPELEKSQKLRREAAWKAVAKILKPISVKERTVKVEGKVVRLPLFRTWYGRDDFERVFAKAYGDMSQEDRAAAKPLTDEQLKKAYVWNVNGAASWNDQDYIDRIKLVTDRQAGQGLGGNSRVSYSPAFVSHLMKNYGPVTDCISKLDSFGFGAEPLSPENFAAPCMVTEFPAEAALIKASWWRSDFGQKLPKHVTDAATLKKRLAGTLDKGGWGTGVGEVDPTPQQIYTVTLSDGANFRMAGLHLVTKETRDWLWITLYWSDDPKSDFGQDRPAEIEALGAPWNQYKMQVVVSFEEKDPDPRGGYTGSLGDALAAVHPGVGGPSWASNPYIERGDKNAQTNCIGCHQHSHVSAFTSETILADERQFPKAGRTKVRKMFPADYTWSTYHAPERLGGVMDARIKAFR